MRIAAEASAATQSRSERRYRKSSPSFSRAKNARNASRDETGAPISVSVSAAADAAET
jgi:hypothetical protein